MFDLKGQCHEIFYYFLPTPVTDLPLVSTTLAKLVAKFAAGVVDTGVKFAAGVVDTGGEP